VGARDFAGLTALHHASRLNRADMAMLLLRHNADVASATANGLTALHCAAENDAAEAALVLLQHGASPHERERLTWQPLHCASWTRSCTTAMVLLAYGADVRSQVDGNQCPALLAQSKGHDELVEMLRRASETFSSRVFRRNTSNLETEVLVLLTLAARRAAATRKMPALPSEALHHIFSFFRRRDLWRIGIVLQEYRPGFWGLPRLTLHR